MKVTSALANKMIKQLEEEKLYWENLETESSSYTAALGEEPIIPEYDYKEISETLSSINKRIASIKHAINVANTTSRVVTEDGEFTIDELLVRMAQLNSRKARLDSMRKKLPKTRLSTTASWGNTSKAPEYRYLNYDVNLVKDDFEKINKSILNIQLALDKHNQTFEFEIEG